MAFDLDDITADLRVELNDASAARWTDAQLEHATQQATAELSRAEPRQVTAEVTVTGRVVTLTEDAPAGIGAAANSTLLRVTAVEWPVDTFPPSSVQFDHYADTLTLYTPEELAAATVRIYWRALHTITSSATTLKDADRGLLVLGASAHALAVLLAERFDTLNVSNRVSQEIAALAAEKMQQWKAQLRPRASTGRLYRPQPPAFSRDVAHFPD